MIQFPGYEAIIKKVYEYNQDHVFAYWNELNDLEKKSFLDELATVDFSSLISLFRETQQETKVDTNYGPAPYIPRPRNDAEKKDWDKATATGVDLIKKGKVAGFIVAGGQGSRLGYDGPKGAFRMSPVKNKSLFQIHAEKMKKYTMKYNVIVPLFIMTSDVNHTATVAHFEENNYFGLDKKDVFLFQQNMIPSLDTNGKLILSGKCSIFKNPDGHGGSLTALHTSGALKEMKKRGIDFLTYIQVDNPLVNIVDPSFIGFHAMNNADISSKALIKAYPEEKIGSFVKFSDGKEGVVEYSDLPKEKMFQKNSDGTLTYAPGSIAIHVFSCQFIEQITSGGSISLPFHVARKKIKQYQPAGAVEIDGFKFEKFVFDAMPLAKKALTIETIREEEFAPVKNATGVDSVDTSQELMSNLFRSWLIRRKIIIPSKVRVIEISPLIAVDADDLDGSLNIPEQEKVYIG